LIQNYDPFGFVPVQSGIYEYVQTVWRNTVCPFSQYNMWSCYWRSCMPQYMQWKWSSLSSRCLICLTVQFPCKYLNP